MLFFTFCFNHLSQDHTLITKSNFAVQF